MNNTMYALSLLTPFDIDANKIRIGSKHDGGYILSDKLQQKQNIISYGIDGNASFDLDLAFRGHKVFLFDHTIDSPPVDHVNFNFFREGVAGVTDETQLLYSVADHVTRHNIVPDDMVMKIDVEGAEWDLFDQIDPALLSKTSQMIVEFHWLTTIDNDDFREKFIRVFEKINKHFVIFHVHANNCAMPRFVNGLIVPEVLEISLVRRDLVQIKESKTVYPTHIDNANDRGQTDCILSFFPFLPATSTNELDQTINRVIDQRLQVISGWL